MGQRFSRPCSPSDVSEKTPVYEESLSWAKPLATPPVPWEQRGLSCGFDLVFTIVRDNDWDRLLSDRYWRDFLHPPPLLGMVAQLRRQEDPIMAEAGQPVRYVIVTGHRTCELRIGKTNKRAIAANVGGTHSHMFSESELRSAEDAGTPIRAGWLLGLGSLSVEIQ